MGGERALSGGGGGGAACDGGADRARCVSSGSARGRGAVLVLSDACGQGGARAPKVRSGAERPWRPSRRKSLFCAAPDFVLPLRARSSGAALMLSRTCLTTLALVSSSSLGAAGGAAGAAGAGAGGLATSAISAASRGGEESSASALGVSLSRARRVVSEGKELERLADVCVLNNRQ